MGIGVLLVITIKQFYLTSLLFIVYALRKCDFHPDFVQSSSF